METGFLTFRLTSAHDALPVEGATITVMDQQDNILYQLTSDESGNTENVPLAAPDSSLSLEPSTSPPYSLYNANINKDGYNDVIVYDIAILGGELAIQPVNMVPAATGIRSGNATEIIFNMPNNLLNDEPRQPPEPPELETRSLRDVIIPHYITVHLGIPTDTSAKNVRVGFIDYLKNVASHEIYATWPSASLEANILAQISFALNRIYTQWYRGQNKNFDITNSTTVDQYYVHGGTIYQSVSNIVDEIFNNYIRRLGRVEPFFAQYCNGTTSTCRGLSQWGTVPLAQAGLSAFEILRRFYPQDIEIVQSNLLEDINGSFPGTSLRVGTRSADVQQIQVYLNRISDNYPRIPKISSPNGYFGSDTEVAVKVFQSIFGLVSDGIIGPATWYRISYLYAAVIRLAELDSEGAVVVGTVPPNVVVRQGSTGNAVSILQLILTFIAEFVPEVPPVSVTGTFGTQTNASVIAFQRYAGLTADGIVGPTTWNALYSFYNGLNETGIVPETPTPPITGPAFPGTLLRIGSRGDNVRLMQTYLSRIAQSYPSIPNLAIDGIFGNGTHASVVAFQRQFGLGADGIIGPITWNKIVEIYNSLNTTTGNQSFPGTLIQLGSRGDSVRLMQNYLNTIANAYGLFSPIAVDGIFGQGTRNAVITFQRNFGLTPDGIIGPITWRSIVNEYNKIVNNRNLIQAMSNALLGRMLFR